MKFIEAIPITLYLSGIFVVVPITLAQVPAKMPTRVFSQTLANNQQERSVGGLYVQSEEGQQQVFPLKHTEVNAKVTGNVS
ncbi:hypothetical protein, partial [Coleofasciculus sp.]|uniref:hypothetical protein n=1 Tax=Coleofasciculus sp. TaxID=3100458 RepID=UPI003A1A374C